MCNWIWIGSFQALAPSERKKPSGDIVKHLKKTKPNPVAHRGLTWDNLFIVINFTMFFFSGHASQIFTLQQDVSHFR